MTNSPNQRCLAPRRLVLYATLLYGFAATPSVAGDWPMAQLNAHRNAYTAEKIDAPRLDVAWSWQAPTPPRPAWHGPAKWDAYNNVRTHSMRNYDAVFAPIVVGDRLYWGSSVDDAVHAVDATTGEPAWTFFTEGAVRVAPTYVDGRLYFGSDDGHAYCINAEDGALVWKHRPSTPTRRILNNGRFIPFWPVRTGVVVDNGTAYFAASMLPWKETFLCALDAETGEANGSGRFVRRLEGVTLEGPIVVSRGALIVPQGRVPPMLFRRSDGEPLGALDGGGGSFVVLLSNERIVHGPGNKTGWITYSDQASREKIAAHNNGRALVSDGTYSYVLTHTTLSATDLKTQEETWRAPCEDGMALIGAGNVLFVGRADAVAAYDASDGRLLWSHEVDGRASGLAAAGGRLYVSTDVGVLYRFTPSSSAAAPQEESAEPQVDLDQLAAIQHESEEGLIDRWVFQQPYVSGLKAKNLAGGLPAVVDGRFRLPVVGEHQALAMAEGETSVQVTDKIDQVQKPKRQLSAAAWVRADEAQSWCGLVGLLQDNGDDERGWLLGIRDGKFCFAVAAREGEGKLTYLTAPEPYQLRSWHHVAGVYDGQTIELFVDGQQVAESTAQKGDIHYPEKGFYDLGAYHDDDEHFRLEGMLHEVRVYDRALAPAEIDGQYRQKADRFPPPVEAPPKETTHLLAAGPWLEFTEPGVAVVRWKTAEPSPTRLTYRLDDQSGQLANPERTTNHEVRLTGLRHNRLYHYVIEHRLNGRLVKTPSYECDTFFNYLPHRPPERSANNSLDPEIVQAADEVLAAANVKRGLCLVWGADDGQFAEALVRRSDLNVLVVVDRPETADRIRRTLHEIGIYGSRIAVLTRAALDDVPLTPYWCNLLVVDHPGEGGVPGVSAAYLRRMLSPRGVAVAGSLQKQSADASRLLAWCKSTGVENAAAVTDNPGWVRFAGQPFGGVGQWSHIYASANNSAFGGEVLEGVNSTSDLDVQWLGRPGPRYQADRNGRKPPPLATAGRLFLQGLHRIVALDHYNGTILWSLELPHFERFNMPRDCGNWCADETTVYAAVRDRCWLIDAETGAVRQRVDVKKMAQQGADYDWGYLASSGNLTVGSGTQAGTSWKNFFLGAGWYDATSGPETYQLCSDVLFAADKGSENSRWQYSSGVILNSTITIGDETIYLAESRSPAVKASDERRVGMDALWDDLWLVALDAASGEKRWERPLEAAPGRIAFYLAHSDGRLVLVSSADLKFHIYAMDDATGEPLWSTEVPWGKGKADHGSHLSRPAIVGNRLFVRPAVIDLNAGKVLDEEIPVGGCGTYACSSDALFFRDGSGGRFSVWNPDDGSYSHWDRLRPDCWLSSIPAGGMLLSPEGGGGCSCGNWMETSLGFMPVARLTETPSQ